MKRRHLSYPDAKEWVLVELERERARTYADQEHTHKDLSPWIIAICEAYLNERREESKEKRA